MDYSVISGAVSFTDVITAISAIALSVAGIYVIIRGVKILYSMIK